MSKLNKVVYLAIMPGIYGYGLEGFGATVHDAVNELHKEWIRMGKGYGHHFNWKEACEHFAATVRMIRTPCGGTSDEAGEPIDGEWDNRALFIEAWRVKIAVQELMKLASKKTVVKTA